MLAVTALAGAVLGVLGLATSGSVVAAPKTLTITNITFTEGVCGSKGAHCKEFPVGPNPQGFGGRLIFVIPLKSKGKLFGYERGECVNLTKASQLNYCTYNINLPGGAVSVQGSLPYSTKISRTIPVTGGTGTYLGAYGSLTLVKGTFPVQYGLHIVTP